jgi:HK97 family phage major capsid protein
MGAALLVGHNPDDQVGVIEDYALADQKLRVLARFSRSARGEEIWQDVLDGIRRNASVGYVIHQLILESQDGDVCTYRVTDWEPLEGSLVSIPADASVGVGRNHQPARKEFHMPPEESLTRAQRRAAAHGNENTEQQTTATGEAATRELDRMRDLLAAGNQYRDLGGLEVANALIADPTATQETFKQRMLSKIATKGGATHTAEPFEFPGSVAFASGAREILDAPKHFKGARAQENAYESGMWLKALYNRDDNALRWCKDRGFDVRAMSAQTNVGGGALVPGPLAATIIDLAEHYGAFRRESDVWPMNSDQLAIPRSTGDPTVSFMGESDAMPKSQGTWDNVLLAVKKLGCTVLVPSELMEDAVINLADRVAFQLGRAFAKKEDDCGFNGDGTSTYGRIRGVLQLIKDGSHNAGKITAATGHDLFIELDVTDLATLVAALPEYAHDRARFYCSQVAWATTFFRLMAASAGNSLADLTAAGTLNKSYGGYPVVTSPVLPNVTTTLVGQPMILFGDLHLASKFGSRRDMQIKILTEAYADNDQIGIMATERFDVVNHDLGNNTTAGPLVCLVGG